MFTLSTERQFGIVVELRDRVASIRLCPLPWSGKASFRQASGDPRHNDSSRTGEVSDVLLVQPFTHMSDIQTCQVAEVASTQLGLSDTTLTMICGTVPASRGRGRLVGEVN